MLSMKSIFVSYPYFLTLPKGLKMLLVESEGHFYSASPSSANAGNGVVFEIPEGTRDIAPASPSRKRTEKDRNDLN